MRRRQTAAERGEIADVLGCGVVEAVINHPPAKDDQVVGAAYALVRERYFTTAVELDDIRRTVASKNVC